MFDIVALGESLIDFTPSGENSQGIALFARNPGGAPANVLAMAAKLGGKTAFIGKVGDDAFGAFLKKTMEDAGVDVRGLRMTREYPTTLAFVQLTPEGDRSFTFYRKPGADVMLAPADVDRALLRDCRIFHFGSVSLTDEPCRTATLEAAREAKAAGAMISYDPNYRPFLWDSAERAREALLAALPLADIVKVSEEEMELLTGEVQLAAGADALASRGAALVLVTLGPRGAYYRAAAGRGLLPACEVDTVDTTGAGDAFLGALLSCLAGKTLEELRILPQAQWERIVAFANAAGSLTTAAKGAIPAMPAREQILRLCGEWTNSLRVFMRGMQTVCPHCGAQALFACRSLRKGDRAVFQRGDYGQRFQAHSRCPHQRAAALLLLFNDDAAASALRARLPHDVDEAQQCLSPGEEIVQDEHSVLRAEKFFG